MKQHVTSRTRTVMLLAAAILMMSLVAGCAANREARENAGSLKLSLEVSEIFQTYRVLPNHRYYYTGSNTKPSAIIGIDQDYTLSTRLWKEVPDLTSEQLKKWVDHMLGFRPPVRTFGASILNGKGEQVGVWYSPFNNTPVAVQADNRVEIIPPSRASNPGMPRKYGGF